MKIAITGASGLIGSALYRWLQSGSHKVGRLTRGEPEFKEDSRWNPDSGVIDPDALEDVEAVVHLAGENVAGRWTPAKMQEIRDSRVQGTALLCRALTTLKKPPGVLVCASAVGYYGDRGDEILTEESSPGSGFLAEVCRECEAAADTARQAGIRVVHLRIAMVLSRDGGALARLELPFRMGLGGPLGNGRQYWSWIVLSDLLNLTWFAIKKSDLSGPINASSPNPVRNAEFAQALARTLEKRAPLRVPQSALHLLFGEMAEATLLASARVLPQRAEAAGFKFAHGELGAALAHLYRDQV